MQSHSLATREPVPQHPPAADDIRAELERILSSPRLEASDRRRSFLRYIVEETLAGRSSRLKGYTVALSVFGRDETFDSQTDPVVRLEARRLRRDLDSYYVDAGSADPVRISIPKGSYVPHFEWHETAASPAVTDADAETPPGGTASASGVEADTSSRPGKRPARRYALAAGLVLAAIVIALAAWYLAAGKTRFGPAEDARGPAVVVLPFEPMGTSADSRYLAEGIGQELVNDLLRFPSFRLYIPPIGLGAAADVEPITLGRELGVGFVVTGSVRADATTVRVAAQLVEADNGRVLWTGIYDRPFEPAALIGAQSDLAEEIATALGQPYGVVNNDLNDRLTTPAVSNMQSYVCVLRAYAYRRSFSRDAFGPVLDCLEGAVRRDPDYSDAWAMLGWLYLDAGRYEFAGTGSLQEAYEKALQAATRAVALQPDNTLALKALSSIDHYMGRYEESERLARRATDLNPNDPDTLAQLGWRLAVRGKFDEGIPILKRAIERTPNPPGWYYHLVAVDLYLKSAYEEMLNVAQRSAVNGSGVSQMLIAVAAGALERPATARQALDAMASSGALARDPAAYLRRHGATDDIVAALMAGLDNARQVASGN